MSPGTHVSWLKYSCSGSEVSIRTCVSHCQEHITLWIQGSPFFFKVTKMCCILFGVLLPSYMLAVFMCFHGRQIFPNSQIQCFYNTFCFLCTHNYRQEGYGGGEGREGEGREGGGEMLVHVCDQCWSVCGLLHITVIIILAWKVLYVYHWSLVTDSSTSHNLPCPASFLMSAGHYIIQSPHSLSCLARCSPVLTTLAWLVPLWVVRGSYSYVYVGYCEWSPLPNEPGILIDLHYVHVLVQCLNLDVVW